MLHPAVTPNINRFVQGPMVDPNLAGYDLLYYGYYHRTVLTAGAQTTPMTFFTTVNGATLLTTNMKGGEVPKLNAFLAQFINCLVTVNTEADLVTDTEYADTVKSIHMMIHKTVTVIKLGPTEYLTIPTWRLPAGGGLDGSSGTSAAATSVGLVGSGVPHIQNAWPCRMPIEAKDTIDWTLNFPASITTINDMAVTMTMTGTLLRPPR